MTPDWISHVSHPLRPAAWPAVDVGGTSLRVLLVEAVAEQPLRVVVRREVPTPRGLANLLDQLRLALAAASAAAAQRGLVTARFLAIGTPGRIYLGSDGQRRIAPRSATNLEAFPGEFDGVNLVAELSTALGLPSNQIFWENDAVVQGCFLISELLRRPDAAALIRGRPVVCINPGTGLGGCVAQVTSDGETRVFTDSHISELKVDPIRLAREIGGQHLRVRSTPATATIEVAVNDRTRSIPSPAGKQAEDFISGTGVSLIASALERLGAEVNPGLSLFLDPSGAIKGELKGSEGISTRVLSGLLTSNEPSRAAAAARFVGDLGGLGLAQLVRVLNAGQPQKCPGFPDWTPADSQRLRGVSRFVLGGGITKTALGRHMIAKARHELRHMPELVLFEMGHITADAGALGAGTRLRRELLAVSS